VVRENTGQPLETQWRDAEVVLTTIRMGVAGGWFYVTEVSGIAGPVVQRATLLESDNGDALKITFSEPVDCSLLTGAPPESAFVYIDKSSAGSVLNGAEYAGSCATSFVSEIKILLPPGTNITPWLDSIAFKGSSTFVVDTSGDNPPRTGRKAAIEASQADKIVLAPSANPVSPRAPIDANVRRAYAEVVGDKQYGVVVGVHSQAPLKSISLGSRGNSYGSADIYDATGNLVETRLPVIATSQPGVYGIYWDIRNRNKRLVGNGTYLMIVTTTELDGDENRRRIKIGVQR
jgi:hypothetical protein